MSDYLKYMDEPDIVNEAMPLRKIFAVRLMFHDKIKNMSPKERANFFNNEAQAIIDKYGMKSRFSYIQQPKKAAVAVKPASGQASSKNSGE